MIHLFRTALAALTLSAAAMALPAAADPAPGMVRLADTSEAGRPLSLSIWYPSAANAVTLVGGNAVFTGVSASATALDAGAAFPLVLLSHGGLRSASDSGAWLAAALADAGFLVVEVNEPRPLTAEAAVNEIWRRPADISRALDLILADPVWGNRIDRYAISVLGHALGGTAALAIAGDGPDPALYRQSCMAPAAPSPDCAWFAAEGTAPGDADAVELARSRRDVRVAHVVAIDPEYWDTLRHTDTSSDVRVLYLSLGTKPIAGREGSQSLTLPGASVYDAFSLCTASGADILREEGEDPALCATSAAQRSVTHGKIANAVAKFLSGAGSR